MPEKPSPATAAYLDLLPWMLAAAAANVALAFAKFGSRAGAATLACVAAGLALTRARTPARKIAAGAVMAASAAAVAAMALGHL